MDRLANRASFKNFRVGFGLSVLWLALLGAGPALAESAQRAALMKCTPGAQLTACQAALKIAGVKFEATPTGEPNHLWVPLEGPYLAVNIVTDDAKSGRINLVDFQSELPVGKARKEVLNWLRPHLQASREIAAQGNRGCGASGGGPAWILPDSTSTTEPGVQLAIDSFPSLQATAGRPLATVFSETRAKPVHLCFLSSNKQPNTASVLAGGVMVLFLRSSLLDPPRAGTHHN